MIASSLLGEGYLQPAGELSKNAADGISENPFLDNPDAFYYFVSEKCYPFIRPVVGAAPSRFYVDFNLYWNGLSTGPSPVESSEASPTCLPPQCLLYPVNQLEKNVVYLNTIFF